MRPLIALTILIALTGCASGVRLAMPAVPPERAASLTVIRSSIMGACCVMPLLVDGQTVMALGIREYATVVIPAGERIVAMDNGAHASAIRVTVSPGEHVYVIMDLGVMTGRPRVASADDALKLISGLRQVE